MTTKTAITAITNFGGNQPTPTATTFRCGGGGGPGRPEGREQPQLSQEDFPPLPALRCLGNLNGVRPVVVIDTREQAPLPFRRLEVVQGTLQTGDYSFLGGEEVFAVERKTVADLTGCCTGSNRDRLFRELHRLRGFRFKRLLIVGTVAEIEARNYVSQVSPQAVLATLGAIEARFDVGVVLTPSAQTAAGLVENWVWYFCREIVEQANTLARAHGLTRRPAPASPSTPAQ